MKLHAAGFHVTPPCLHARVITATQAESNNETLRMRWDLLQMGKAFFFGLFLNEMKVLIT